MDYETAAKENMQRLKENEYPGRGIIIGQTPDSTHYVQIYWIMGRSENSRNRIFEQDGTDIRTSPYIEEKVKDPSLIIYYPVRSVNGVHIITNGDQTDTIYDYLKKEKSFEDALATREYEPDAPNFTPRISGIVSAADGSYKLSILKSLNINTQCCQRSFYRYDNFQKGYGHCIHTYKSNGEPIPPYEGEPYIVSITDTIEENKSLYWDLLNTDNRISLLVKFIDCSSGKSETAIINKNI